MKFKRMFSFFLSFAMLFSLFLPAYATQAESVDTEVQTHILRILASIEHEKEKYGLKDVNFSSVQIGTEIPAYKVQNGQLTSSDVRLIPLLSNGEIVSLFYIAHLSNGELFVQLTDELVDPITAQAEANPFAVVYDDEGAYIYVESELILLGKVDATTYAYEDTLRHNALFPSETLLLSSSELADSGDNLVSCLAAEQLQEIEVKPIATKKVLNVDSFSGNLLSPAAATAISAYLPVEIYQQPLESNWCWAICVASIANYVFGTSNTPEGIAELFVGGQNIGMYTEDVIYCFNNIFHTSWLYSYTTTLAPGTALTYLEAGYPLYGDFTRTGGAHAVVIRGINTTMKTYSIMNPTPTTSGYTVGTISDSNVWSFIGYNSTLHTLRCYGFPGQI